METYTKNDLKYRVALFILLISALYITVLIFAAIGTLNLEQVKIIFKKFMLFEIGKGTKIPVLSATAKIAEALDKSGIPKVEIMSSIVTLVATGTYLIFSSAVSILYYIVSIFPNNKMIKKLDEINLDLIKYKNKSNKNNNKKPKRSELITYYKEDYLIVTAWADKKNKAFFNSLNFLLSNVIILVVFYELQMTEKELILLSIFLIILSGIFVNEIFPVLAWIDQTKINLKKYEKNEYVENWSKKSKDEKKSNKRLWMEKNLLKWCIRISVAAFILVWCMMK